MKKVTFLTQYYLPEIGAPPARISETAAGLVRRGHIVKVVTAVPNRPEGAVHEGFRDQFVYRSVENEISITRVAILIPKIFGDFVNRLISEASFVVSAVIFAFRELRGSEVIIIQNPPLFSGLLTPILKVITKAKVINWCSDVWPDLHLELGTLRKGGVVAKVMKLIQKISLYCADAVAVTTSKTIDQVQTVYGVNRTFLWPNAVDTSYFYPHEADANSRASWGVDGSDFVVGYAGLHGNFQDLNIVLDAAKLIVDGNVKFVLVGDGPQKPHLKARVVDEGIDNVILADAVLRASMPNTLQAFDILLVPLAKPMPTTIPSKFYECISSGKPVIVVAGSEISAIVEQHSLGSVYDCGDENSLFVEIVKLYKIGPTALSAVGERARKLAFDFDREKVVDRIHLDLESL